MFEGQFTILSVFTAMLSKEQLRDRYTEDQWEKLHAYWGHQLFRRCRPIGYLLAFVAAIASIPPLLSAQWIKYYIHKESNFTYGKYICVGI